MNIISYMHKREEHMGTNVEKMLDEREQGLRAFLKDAINTSETRLATNMGRLSRVR